MVLCLLIYPYNSRSYSNALNPCAGAPKSPRSLDIMLMSQAVFRMAHFACIVPILLKCSLWHAVCRKKNVICHMLEYPNVTLIWIKCAINVHHTSVPFVWLPTLHSAIMYCVYSQMIEGQY